MNSELSTPSAVRAKVKAIRNYEARMLDEAKKDNQEVLVVRYRFARNALDEALAIIDKHIEAQDNEAI
jgi:hypothetical protein